MRAMCSLYDKNNCIKITMYCKSVDAITSQVAKVHSLHVKGRQRQAQGRTNEADFRLFKKFFFDKKDQLFDVFTDKATRRVKCWKEWGLRMMDRDLRYYEDQKGPKLQDSDNRCGPLFYHIWLKNQRLQEAHDQYKNDRAEQFRYKSLDAVKRVLEENGEIVSPSSGSGEDTTEEQGNMPDEAEGEAGVESEPPKNKRRTYQQSESSCQAHLPEKFMHIRESERKVKDSFC